MIVKPKIRGFICTTAHPTGCAEHVNNQIQHVKSQAKLNVGDFKNVLVLGCSGGYGLASRIVAGFGAKANTLGVSLEKEPSDKKTASAGWYNNKACKHQIRLLQSIWHWIEGVKWEVPEGKAVGTKCPHFNCCNEVPFEDFYCQHCCVRMTE